MKSNIVKLGCLLLIIACLSACKNQDNKIVKVEENWIQLFNGKDIDDWIVKIRGHAVGDNYKNTFRAKNGVLEVNYDEYDTFDNSFGHIYFKKPFSNYKFRLEYRFTGAQLKDGAAWAHRNSGVMLHCQNPESIGLNQKFPVSIEVQLLGGLGDEDRPTANVCTPGTHIYLQDDLEKSHCITSISKTYHGDQWVKLEVLVRSDSIISHKINGETVLTYYKPQLGGDVDFDNEKWKLKDGLPVKSGYISLQSESSPVEFRNIELLELK